MRVYFLLRDTVPMGEAIVAAAARTDRPDLLNWLTGSAELQHCLVDDQEFERARNHEGAILLSSKLRDGREVAIAFGPREEWPEEFGRFRDFFAEREKQREEQENITEEKWLTCDDRPLGLANFALPSASPRQIRLFAVACCDLVADRMVDPRTRRAAAVALLHASGAATDEELRVAGQEADDAVMSLMLAARAAGVGPQSTPEYGAAALAYCATAPFDRTPTPDMPDGWLSLCAAGSTSDFLIWHTMQASNGEPLIDAKLTGILREICGNPFRPVVAKPTWQSPGLRSLARKVYDLRAFDLLPALASALEDAGCNDPTVLEHCRIPGQHVRGCWVVDLVLE
jgi:hypothetical protein